jgi:hypothetical protein
MALNPDRHLPYSRQFSLQTTFKGTWQRGGFSGVFAEIGSA